MKRKLLFFTSAIVLSSTTLQAQPASSTHPITGRVLDASTRNPMEYVNIVLYNSSDSTLVTGAITHEDGTFTLPGIPAGQYYVHVRLLGYEARRFDRISIGNAPLALGDILMTASSIRIGDVVVEGSRPTFSYQIDKKVIDVDQLATTISGTAADVLSNIPSVSVDIEGNVSLRGSGNFTVLIDGKPSVLDAQDALQQIAASTIDRIEIITNPSAKHDPEGAAGVINITMKKQSGRGWSGMANANVGLSDKYGGDMLFEHKDGSTATLLGIDYNSRLHPGTSMTEEQYVYQNASTTIRSTGDMRMQRNTFGLRGAVEFAVGEQGQATLSGRYGNREWQRNSALQHDLFSSTGTAPVASRNILHRRRGGYFSALNAGYQHLFTPHGHKLTGDLIFRYSDSDELTTSELFNETGLASGKKTTEDGPSRDLNTRLEYVLPFSETNRFEAGYHGEIDLSEEATTLSDYDSASGQYVLQAQFSNRVNYTDNTHAFYSLYAGEWGSLGYQAGLRSENTRRLIQLAGGSESLIDRWDLFPTIHVSYKFSDGSQTLASYTRRINRPRGWQLEPFETWIDANNVRRGNPAILPELVDSYELGIQLLPGQVSLSLEGYHRVSHNKVEDIRSVYSNDVTLTTFDNIGTEFSSGMEFLANFDIVQGWNVSLVGNAYNYRIEGVLFSVPFTTQSFNWSARMNNVIKATATTQFQLNAMWNSPTVSAQGRREGFLSVDVAAKQEFINKQLSVTLQVQNLLGTAKHEFTSQGAGFSSFSHHKMESPVVMLTARLSINNYQPEREGRRDEGFGGEDF